MDLSVIDRAYLTVQNLLNAGFPLLENMVWVWFGVMCAWAVFLGLIEWVNGQSPMGMIGGMFVRLGVFVYLASVWKTVIDGMGNFALEIGLRISGTVAQREQIMSPSGIFALGNEEAQRILEAKDALCAVSWTTCIVTTVDQLLLEVLAIGVWICFGILMLSLVMAALTFKKHGLFAFMFLPFSQLKATAFLTESAISGVIQGAVWLAFIGMVAGFGSIIFGFMALPKDPTIDDILPAFLVYAFVALMGWQSRTFAQGIVTGTTRIGGEALNAMARNTLGWMTGGASIAQRLAMSAEGPVRSIANAGGATVHAGRSAHARLTGAPAPPPRAASAGTSSSGSGGSRPTPSGGAWNLAPTEKQQAAASKRGIDLSGMTRGQASQVLETKGNMDPSWYNKE